MPPFDAHAHLPAGPAPPGTVRVVCGTEEGDWAAVLAAGPGTVPFLGLHPWRLAAAAAGWPGRLEARLRAHPGAGLGECGLDFARPDADRAAQREALQTQLRLARALGRPVALHTVRAWGDLLSLLDREGAPPDGALVHAFSGSPEVARELQARGLYLGFGGDLLDLSRARARAACQAVAPDRLLLETDGAADLDAVLQAAAELRGMAPADLAAQVLRNGRNWLGLRWPSR